MTQVVFNIHVAEEGGFWVEAEELSISTQGEDLDELEAMIRDAVEGYFFDNPAGKPDSIVWRFAPRPRAA